MQTVAPVEKAINGGIQNVLTLLRVNVDLTVIAPGCMAPRGLYPIGVFPVQIQLCKAA